VEIGSAPFMAGSSEGWIDVERMRLNVARYGSMIDLGRLLLAFGNASESLLLARDAIEIVPEREEAHLLAVKALLALGHLDEFPDSAFQFGANLGSFWVFRTSGFEACQFYADLFTRYRSYPESSTVLRASYGHSVVAHFVQAPDISDIY